MYDVLNTTLQLSTPAQVIGDTTKFTHTGDLYAQACGKINFLGESTTFTSFIGVGKHDLFRKMGNKSQNLFVCKYNICSEITTSVLFKLRVSSRTRGLQCGYRMQSPRTSTTLLVVAKELEEERCVYKTRGVNLHSTTASLLRFENLFLSIVGRKMRACLFTVHCQSHVHTSF